MRIIHSFYDEAEGAPSFGRDLYQSLAGFEPKGQKDSSRDKTEVNDHNIIHVADVDNCDKEQEYGADEVVNIFPVQIFTGADVFQEDGDLVWLSPYPICHVNTLISEDDLIIIGADQ